MVITTRIKLNVGWPVQYLQLLDTDKAVELLRHCGDMKSAVLQPEGAEQLVQLCGRNALLLRVLGRMIAGGRRKLEVGLRGSRLPAFDCFIRNGQDASH
jgi:hypothetical protein